MTESSSERLLRPLNASTRNRIRRGRLRSLGWALPALALGTFAIACGAGPAGPGPDGADGSSVGGGVPGGSGVGGTFVPGGGGSPGAGGAQTGTGGEPAQVLDIGGIKISGAPSYYRVNRITHAQWENSVKDLLQLTATPGLASNFFPDAKGNSNFSNNERGLEVNDVLRTDYERAAQTVAQKVIDDAAAMTRLGNGGSPQAFIAALGERAYRRPLTADESAAYLTLWNQGATFFDTGDAFKDGAHVFIEALLQSPGFLYRTELGDSGARLSGMELATKISLLLRNSIPDSALLAAANSGSLDTNEGLLSVVQQLLADEGVAANVQLFFSELYALARQANILKDTTAFPTFNDQTAAALHEADLLFFGDLIASGHGVRDLFLTKTAFVNNAIAPIYGLTAQGTAFKKVTLDDSRPGYLTRAGFLAMNATLKNPDPIHRGVDINVKMLCAELSPPPGLEIPPIPNPEPGQTNREAITALTGEGICGECHGGIINPPGFALEGFDATGKVRTKDAGKDIDTTGSFGAIPGNPAFSGPEDLAQIMAESETAHACFSARLAEYSLARDVGTADTDLVKSLLDNSHGQSASIQNLIVAVVQSPAFTNAK